MKEDLTDYLANYKYPLYRTSAKSIKDTDIDLYSIIYKAYELTLEEAGKKEKSTSKRTGWLKQCTEIWWAYYTTITLKECSKIVLVVIIYCLRKT
jgi:hypothetical protein